MKKYVGVSKNKLNMMRNKSLSMKQRFGLKKKSSACIARYGHQRAFTLKKQNNPSFLQKNVKEWSKKGEIPELTIWSDRTRNEVYFLKE